MKVSSFDLGHADVPDLGRVDVDPVLKGANTTSFDLGHAKQRLFLRVTQTKEGYHIAQSFSIDKGSFFVMRLMRIR